MWEEGISVKKMPPQDYLVGNRLTRVDVHLLELLLYVEEFDASLLTPFPLLKVRPPQRGSHTHASENTWWDRGLRSLLSGLQTELLDPQIEA